ncbi:MAG: hypothetical protein ACOCRK_00815 [bacterium]
MSKTGETERLLESMSKQSSNYETVDLQGLIGAPPIFSTLADTKTDNNPYGKEYVERFITEGNFVAFTCGKAKLLPGVGNKTDRTNFIKHFNSQDGGEEIKKILEDYKYEKLFGFKNAMAEYWKYVDILAGIAAKMMGVDTMARDIFDGVSHFSEMHWGEFKSKFINYSMSRKASGEGDTKKFWQYVPFYNNGIVESSEIIGNMVGQSSVEGMINNIPGKQYLSEVSFITGADVSREIENVNTDSINESMDTGAMGSSGLGGILSGSVSTLGVNVQLPDVWKDSSYDKTYNVKFKFSTPHGDPLSVYMNLIVPICHLLPLVTSRRIGTSNTYTSPFMLRIFSKGMMNCDMGMATAININRHPENISIDGLPTEIDVMMTIKDLYAMMNMPQKPNVSGVIKTAGLMGYLGTLCGYNMNKPDPELMAEIKILYEIKERFSPGDIFYSVKRNVSDISVNTVNSLLETFGLR